MTVTKAADFHTEYKPSAIIFAKTGRHIVFPSQNRAQHRINGFPFKADPIGPM